MYAGNTGCGARGNKNIKDKRKKEKGRITDGRLHKAESGGEDEGRGKRNYKLLSSLALCAASCNQPCCQYDLTTRHVIGQVRAEFSNLVFPSQLYVPESQRQKGSQRVNMF